MEFLYIINLLAAIIASAVLIFKRHWILACAAVSATAIYAYGIIHSGIPQMTELCNVLFCQERYTEPKAIASVYGCLTSLIMTSVMMALYPWLKRWAVFIWFLLFITTGVITGIMSPLGVAEGTYSICCAIMTVLAQMMGISYEVACCIENIYIHSLLPTLFAIPAAYIGIKNIINGKGVIASTITITHFIIDAIITIVIWNHYIHLSIQAATSLCVTELQTVGKMIAPGWAGYITINVIVFIGIFLGDALLSWILFRWVKHFEKNKNET